MQSGKPSSKERDLLGNPQQIRAEFEEITFDSCFDSGNLLAVEKFNVHHYLLWIAPDCVNSPHENKNRTWFYFSVENTKRNQTILFTIKNMNFQERLYKEGFLPVFKVGVSGKWKRIPNKSIKLDKNEGGIELTFSHEFQTEDSLKTFFAFTYPWSYTDNNEFLESLQKEFESDGSIYFYRNTMIFSREGRRVELLVLSSQRRRMPYRENPIPGLFPEDPLNTPFTFMEKKIIMITARVHPGEVPSSHIFNGVLRFLLNSNDPKSYALLDNFVFYLVPLLNPDGVSRGHYRTDSLGQNLNRFYGSPNITEHPAVYAVKELVLQLNKSKKLAMYFDLHAHASKRGCFIYGNSLEFREQIKNCLLPKLIDINTPFFDYDSCNFTEKNMYSKGKNESGPGKEGSSRVTFWKSISLVNCYTVECNYNASPVKDRSSVSYSDKDEFMESLLKKADIKGKQTQPQSYEYLDVSKFEDIGRAICLSTLDFYELNPDSSLTRTKYINTTFLRLHTASCLIREMPYRFDPELRKVMKNLGSETNSKLGIHALLALIDKNAEKEFFQELKKLFSTEVPSTSVAPAEVRTSLPAIWKAKPPTQPQPKTLLKKKSLNVPSRNITHLIERESSDLPTNSLNKKNREPTPIKKRVSSLTPTKL